MRHSHGERTVTWITPPWSCVILVRTELLNDFLQMVTSRDGIMRWHQWRSVSCVCICCCQLGICACVCIILPHTRLSQVSRAPLSEQIVQRLKVCANVLSSLSCRLPSPGIWEVLISVKVGNRGVSKTPSFLHPPTHTHTLIPDVCNHLHLNPPPQPDRRYESRPNVIKFLHVLDSGCQWLMGGNESISCTKRVEKGDKKA